MTTSKKYMLFLIMPILYGVFILSLEYTGNIFYSFFSKVSLKIYRLIYYRKGKILEILPLDDLKINIFLIWLFILFFICFFFIIKNKYFRKGLIVVIILHLILFLLSLIYI